MGTGAVLRLRVDALASPMAYTALFGGAQVALLWLLQDWFALWIPVAGTLALAILPFLLRRPGFWPWKTLALVALIFITTVGPVLSSMDTRAHLGITLEQDGLVQTEAAVDRLMHGQAIYGVDWSDTALAQFPIGPDGPNPALKHFVYFPLQVMVGFPVRAITGAIGVGFDYRLVLIAWLVIALLAVLNLPASAEARYMVAVCLFANPLIARFFWTGHNDVCWIAMVLWALVLVGRRRPQLACLAFGTALAFKAFAALAVPLFALTVFIYWGGQIRGRVRSMALSTAAVLVVPLITMVPFFARNPGAFLTDTVLYNTGTISGGYFISGFGFSGVLLALHLIKHRTDYFPFFAFQVAALLPSLWFGARWFFRGPTLGRWMAAYALVLFAFIFFARFMNDSYIGLTVALAATAPALRGHDIVGAAQPVSMQTAAFAA